MNKKVLRNSLVMIILLSCILLSNTVFAAGTFSLSKSSATITEGGTDTFSINGSSATGRVDITSSDSSVATVSSSSVWLENSSSTITITAKKAGTATITVTGTVSDADGIEDTVTQTVIVTVEAKETTQTNPETPSTPQTPSTPTTPPTEQPKEKSKDANLSTLGVTPKEFDFSGFNKNKTSYSVTVPSDVDSLKVLYKTADSNATVKVTGNSDFEVGSDNEIKVVVTAEDGKTTKTYTIKVTKLAEEEEKPGNLLDDEEGLFLTFLSLENIELSPEFAKDIYSYTAKIDDESVTEIEVNAKANKEDADIEISGNTDLIAGENTINIVVSSEDSTEKVVYQIIVTKPIEEIEVPSIGNNNESGTDLIGNIKKYIGIAIAVVILLIVAVIVLLILLKRENRRLEDDEEEEDVLKRDSSELENKNKNFIESLYRQRNGTLYNEEELDESEKQTLEEINRETDRIFSDKVEGQSVEYTSNEEYNENSFEERKRRRGKGKHSK